MKNPVLLICFALYFFPANGQLVLYSEGFESGTAGWSSYGTASSWAHGVPSGLFISSASSGSKAWVTNLSGSYNLNELSYLQGTPLDLSGLSADPFIQFSHIFQLESIFDRGWVEYSVNGGASWTKLGTAASGKNWYNHTALQVWTDSSGTPSEWRDAIHELTGLAGQTGVLIRFVMRSDATYQLEGIGVDDVVIFSRAGMDARLLAITKPDKNCALTATEEISIVVRNYGSDTIFSVDVSYIADGGSPVTETINDTITPLEDYYFTFAAPADLSVNGAHALTAFTSLPGDTIISNDTLLRIINNNPPPVVDAGADTSICLGDTLWLSGLGGTSWSWKPASSLDDSTLQSPAAFPLFTQSFSLTAFSDSGCPGNDLVEITVLNLESAFVSAFKDTMCPGDTTMLVANNCFITSDDFNLSGLSQLWDHTSSGSLIATCGSLSGNTLYFTGDREREAVTIPMKMMAGGTVSFWMKYGTDPAPPCEKPDPGDEVVLEFSLDNSSWTLLRTMDVTAFPGFSQVIVEVPREAWSGQTRFRWRQVDHNGVFFDHWAIDQVEITCCNPGGSYDYVWSPDGGLSDTALFNPVTDTMQTATYFVSVDDLCGSVVNASYQVTIDSLLLTLPSGHSVCTGDSIRLGAWSNMSGTSFLWSPVAGLSCTTCRAPLASPLGSALYSVTGASAGCSDAASTFVTVNPLPLVIASQDTSMCEGDSIMLTSSGAVSYSWEPASSLTGATLPNPVCSVRNSTTYTVFGSSDSGCISADTVRVEVFGFAEMEIWAGDDTICSGDTTFLSINTCPGMADDFDPGIDIGVWDHILLGTASNLCGSVGGNALYFDGIGRREAVTRNLSVISGGSVSFWIKIADGFPPCELADPEEDILLEYGLENDTTWYLINTYMIDSFPQFTFVEEAIPGSAWSENTRFRVRQRLNSGGDNWAFDNFQVTCLGSNPGVSFDWTPASGLSATNVRDPVAYPPVSVTYRLTASEAGCSVSDSILISVEDYTASAVAISTPANPSCAGDSVTFTASPVNGGIAPAFEWYINGSISGTGNPFSTPFLQDSDAVFAVMKPVTSCPYSADTSNIITMTVFQLPVVSLSGLDTVYCNTDDPVLMSGLPPGGSFAGNGVSGNSFDPNLAGSGFHDIMYTYVDVNGCAGTDTFRVRVKSCVNIPLANPGRFCVWPNPSSGKIFITGGNPGSGSRWAVSDLPGRKITAGLLEKPVTAIDLSMLKAGIYFLELSEDTAFFIKLVIGKED